MEQDTGKFRKNDKDQYYTKAEVAKKCVGKLLQQFPDLATYQWIEPSAGNGVFLKSLPGAIDKVGIDIEPKCAGILKGNFLDWMPTSEKRRVFFGNPPFGRQSSMAKSFIKHAATHADFIAFILPRSFVKPSMSRAFPETFHCVLSEDVEKNAFEVNGKDYDVPCVFQVWQKKNTARPTAAPVKEVGFKYVKHGEAFHIAFKRVGGLAGKCYPFTATAAEDYNKQCFYFWKLDEKYVPYVKTVIEKMNAHVFPSNTVGPRSLSKTEANEVMNSILATLA